MFIYFSKPCLRTFSVPFGLPLHFPFATGGNIDATPCVCEFVGWVGGDASFKIEALQTRFWTHSSHFKAKKYTETTKFQRINREQPWSESVLVCQDPPFLPVGKDVGVLSHALLMEGGGNTIPHRNKKAALRWTDTWTGINRMVGREWISQSQWRQRNFSDTTLDLTHSDAASFLGPCDTSTLPLIKTYSCTFKKTYTNDPGRSKTTDPTLSQQGTVSPRGPSQPKASRIVSV